MQKYSKSRSSLFLLELILNILLFTVLVVIGLNFFVKAHKLTIKTTDLHHAVTECNNIASLYESGDGSLNLISSQYSDIVISDTQALIYFNKDFVECTSSDAMYTLSIAITNQTAQTSEGEILFSKDDDVIYKLDVYNYRQLTPASQEV